MATSRVDQDMIMYFYYEFCLKSGLLIVFFSTFLGSFGGPSGFPGGGLGFGSSQPPQLSRPLGILQSNSNSMPSSAAVSGRNPLFNTRDNRGKIGESLSAFDPSEFPSLGSRENSSAPNPALARSNYGKKNSFFVFFSIRFCFDY